MWTNGKTTPDPDRDSIYSVGDENHQTDRPSFYQPNHETRVYISTFSTKRKMNLQKLSTTYREQKQSMTPIFIREKSDEVLTLF